MVPVFVLLCASLAFGQAPVVPVVPGASTTTTTLDSTTTTTTFAGAASSSTTASTSTTTVNPLAPVVPLVPAVAPVPTAVFPTLGPNNYFQIVPGSVPQPGYKLEIGAWLLKPDTTGSFNRRLGRNLATYQAGVSIPYNITDGVVELDPLPGHDITYIWNVTAWDDGTDASVFMTVYADQILTQAQQGFALVTDAAITALANRLAKVTEETGREVRMRWLPEMNGDWMIYGKQPADYIATWKRMFTIFRRLAPKVILVWSPNYDLPFGDETYWPGAEYVDWVGTSVYWKGYGVNAYVTKDYTANSISSVYYNFALKYNKPFVISECGGAWEIGPGTSPITGASFTTVTNQVDQATFQQSFWAGILSPDVLATFPLLRAVYIFEVAKQEEFYTDFRISAEPSVLAAWSTLVAQADAAGYIKWANKVTIKTSATASVAGATSTGAVAGAAGAASNPSTSAKASGAVGRTYFVGFGLLGLGLVVL